MLPSLDIVSPKGVRMVVSCVLCNVASYQFQTLSPTTEGQVRKTFAKKAVFTTMFNHETLLFRSNTKWRCGAGAMYLVSHIVTDAATRYQDVIPDTFHSNSQPRAVEADSNSFALLRTTASSI